MLVPIKVITINGGAVGGELEQDCVSDGGGLHEWMW